MQRKAIIAMLGAFGCTGLPALVLADQPSSAILPLQVVATIEVVAPVEDEALADDDLLILRGGQALVVANQTLTAINNGSVLNGDYAAGTISFSDNALANFNGFGNVVVNTGAQNNLQSGLNVTINIGN